MANIIDTTTISSNAISLEMNLFPLDAPSSDTLLQFHLLLDQIQAILCMEINYSSSVIINNVPGVAMNIDMPDRTVGKLHLAR